MEFEADVMYGTGKAWYRITREKPGIYYAVLLSFEGSDEAKPPGKITLIRGIRGWKGSNDDSRLLNTLGALIETYFVNGEKKRYFR